MIIAAMVIGAVLFGAGWLLRRQRPSPVDRAVTNGAIIAAIVGSAASSFYFWKTTGHSIDSAWWPLGAVLGSLVWLCVVMAGVVVVRRVVGSRQSREL